ncbi:MAG: FecR family protein [Verrucomicrobiota bacterium]
MIQKCLLYITVIALTYSNEVWSSSQLGEITRAQGNLSRGSLMPPSNPEAVSIQDHVDKGQYLETGVASRAEVLFQNGAITRLGALSVFHFDPVQANYTLDRGEGLFIFPKVAKNKRKPSYISSAGLSASITGTTVYVYRDTVQTEYLCLEGECKIGAHTIGPGDRIAVKGKEKSYAAPVRKFNIRKFIETNELVQAFDTPIPSLQIIEKEAELQDQK